jgi:hypothetical protein
MYVEKLSHHITNKATSYYKNASLYLLVLKSFSDWGEFDFSVSHVPH